MFIGRERELETLERLYLSNRFEFAVLYGRRRVGKTALINQFIGDKNAIYFMGVLCGSSMSYMEDHVLAYKAPLYGRRTAQMKLLPFTFEEACRCLSPMSGENLALMYGAFGGTPQYLLQINARQSVRDNIMNTYLNSASFL